jgi:hypothetical protein
VYPPFQYQLRDSSSESAVVVHCIACATAAAIANTIVGPSTAAHSRPGQAARWTWSEATSPTVGASAGFAEGDMCSAYANGGETPRLPKRSRMSESLTAAEPESHGVIIRVYSRQFGIDRTERRFAARLRVYLISRHSRHGSQGELR